MSKVARGVAQLNSDIAGARNPLTMGKLFGVRETTAPRMTLALPSVLRMKSRFTTSLSAGNSVHFASKSSNRPPTSTTKSTSRVRSRQKNKLPARPARRSRLRNWRSEEHTSELQSLTNLVCRLLLEKKKNTIKRQFHQSMNIRNAFLERVLPPGHPRVRRAIDAREQATHPRWVPHYPLAYRPPPRAT